MSFANPAFLWGLLALAVPVIIHLFSFRKTQQVFFSSTRFLRQVQQATAAKQKLKHWLVLAARLLFLFFLVVAFAQPFIPAKQQVTNTRSVTVYIDNSLSMSVPVSEEARALDAAIRHATKLAEVFPPDTRFRLLTNDFASSSNSYKTKADFLELLSRIRLSAVSRSLTEVATRLAQTEGSGDFYLLSDFQQNTTGTPGPMAFPDSSRKVNLVQFKLRTTANVYADSAWLENPFILPGERNTLNVRLRNTGEKPVAQLSVKLLLDGVQAGVAATTVPALGTAQVTFNLPAVGTRFSKAEIRFNDFAVVFDNQLYLSLNRTERVRVVEIHEQRVTPFIQKVFGNTLVFQLQAFTTANLNYAAVQAADVVVLNEVQSPGPALVEMLRNYVRAGGTLLLIPAARQQADAITALAGRPVYEVPDEEKLEIQQPDFSHPFFRNIVEKSNTRLPLFQAKRVINWGSDRAALLKLKNDMPLLSVFRQGSGSVYLFGSPLQPEYTDFGTHFLFLPVMYRMAITSKKVWLKPYYSLVENQVSLRTDSATLSGVIRLSGERELIPDQRRQGDRLVLELPRHDMVPGFYFARHETDTLALLAFNVDKRESNLTQHTEESLLQAFGNRPHIRFMPGDTEGYFTDTFRATYLGTPLWRYALVLALLFLLAETMLLRFWR
jgi:hypothetical protein